MASYNLSDVISYHNFEIALGSFLDVFYRTTDTVRYEMISSPPQVKNNSNTLNACILAAAAHKLSNDYGLDVPDWVYSPIYTMPYPVYAYNTKNPEYQEFLRENAPSEYASRNLYYSNVLERV